MHILHNKQICCPSSSKSLFIEPLLETALMKNLMRFVNKKKKRKNTCNVTTRIKIYLNCCMLKIQFKRKRIAIVALIQPILRDKSAVLASSGGNVPSSNSCDHESNTSTTVDNLFFFISVYPFIPSFLQIASPLSLLPSHARIDD